MHKAGKPLREIAEETSLGLRTVRTIIAKGNGTDRSTIKHLERIAPTAPANELGKARLNSASTCLGRSTSFARLAMPCSRKLRDSFAKDYPSSFEGSRLAGSGWPSTPPRTERS
jgi:predicted ATPase